MLSSCLFFWSTEGIMVSSTHAFHEAVLFLVYMNLALLKGVEVLNIVNHNNTKLLLLRLLNSTSCSDSQQLATTYAEKLSWSEKHLKKM